MMHGAYMVGHETGLGKVGRTLQAHCKRVETRPPGFGLAVILDAVLGIFLCNGTYHRRVKPAGKQYSVGHIAHQLTLHGILKCIVYGVDACVVVLHVVIFHPVTGVVTLHATLFARIVVAGKELLVAVALTLKGFQFAGNINQPVAVVADVKGDDPNGVAGNKELVALGIVESKSEDAAQVFEKGRALVTIEGEYHLAVAACLKLIAVGVAAAQVPVVVNLTVDSQHLLAVGTEQRLPTRLRVND